MINENVISSIIFRHPFTCMVAGPTQCGKSTLIKKILESNKLLIEPAPDRIVYCYKRWQDGFSDLMLINPRIEFKQGLAEIEEFDKSINNLLVLDDLMKEGGKEESIYDIFTVESHHLNISVFLLAQNLFPKEKNSRTISLNCNYLTVLNNPRDRAQFMHLGRQMFPKNQKFIEECFNDAVESKKYGYLFLDLHQATPNNLRVQTGITPDEKRYIYEII